MNLKFIYTSHRKRLVMDHYKATACLDLAAVLFIMFVFAWINIGNCSLDQTFNIQELLLVQNNILL